MQDMEEDRRMKPMQILQENTGYMSIRWIELEEKCVNINANINSSE